jgi:hypothetical protein
MNQLYCPDCHTVISNAERASIDSLTCPNCGASLCPRSAQAPLSAQRPKQGEPVRGKHSCSTGCASALLGIVGAYIGLFFGFGLTVNKGYNGQGLPNLSVMIAACVGALFGAILGAAVGRGIAFVLWYAIETWL